MMFSNCAAQTFSGFSGLGGFGSPDARPNPNYVMAGDVIRIQLYVDASGGVVAPDASAFKNALEQAGHVHVLSFDDSQLSTFSYWSGNALTITLDVQAINDFGKINDLLGYVAGVAQNTLSVDAAHSSAAFVSKVEVTKGDVPNTIPAPKPPPDNSGGNNNPNNVGSNLEKFFQELTKSPTTLAVILGAAVILVIAAKK